MAKKTHCDACGHLLEPFADEPRVDHCPMCCPGTQADHDRRITAAGEAAWAQHREALAGGAQAVSREVFDATRSAGIEDVG